MIQPLHNKWHPGEPAFDPDYLQLWETLGKPVDHPVCQMDEAVVHEGNGVHGDEAVKLQERWVAPVEARMEAQGLAHLLDQRIELHVLVVVDRLVTRSGNREANYALGLAEIPDDVETSLWGIEGQVEQRLDAIVLGQNALDQPAVVGAADGGLDVVLGVHAEHQHGRREYYLVVETHRIHGAARQLSEMVALAAVNCLGQGHLVGDAPVDVLEEGARLGVE